MKKKLLSLTLLTLVFGAVNAQSTEELKQKFKDQNLKKEAQIDAIQLKSGSAFLQNNKTAIAEFSKDQVDIDKTDDIRANVASNVDQIQNGAVGGFSINGENMAITIFDGGKILSNHIEFRDTENEGLSRIVDLENGAQGLNSHATAVGGFIGAEGRGTVISIPNVAKGVLPKATIKHAGFATTSNGDRFTKILEFNEFISNHSYGVNNGWSQESATSGTLGAGYYYPVNTTIFSDPNQTLSGAYQSNDANIDQIVYVDPRFTIVKSSGNYYGTGPGPNDAKYRWANGAYTAYVEGDLIPNANCSSGAYCIGNGSLAKNIIVVGAVNIPTTSDFKITSPSHIVRSSYSSVGPRKDGAIKPDIVAVGTLVVAPTYSSDNPTSVSTYTRGSGTSYSAPKVTGAVGAITQLKRLLTNDSEFYFNADEVKTILLHTAMEAGLHDGPDNAYGWGMLDALKAAEVVLSTHNNEDTLERNDKVSGIDYEKVISAREGEELKVTISWIDPAATILPGTLDRVNDISSKLVNDLDLRIIDTVTNEVYFPWKLDLANVTGAAVKGDNTVDNVEQVVIKTPVAGRNYKVVVSNKENLVDDLNAAANQKYSLLITGANAENLSTADFATKDKVSVYPTVAKDVVNIDSTAKINAVELIDLTGKLISTTKTNKVNVSSLPSGVYVLKITTDKGVTTKKIVKQ